MKKTLEQLTLILEEAIKAEIFPGACLALVNQKEVEYLNLGKLRSTSDDQKVETTTIYDLASITKLITAILALQLIEEKKLSFNDNLAKYSPITKDFSTGKLTVWQLLTSLPNFAAALSDNKDLEGERLLEFIFQANYQSQQKQEIIYSNTAFILLGLVIEQIAGVSIDQLAQSKIFTPLAMNQTSWGNLSFQKGVAPSEIDKWRKRELVGEIHDESAWKLYHDLGICVGSAGVFANIQDCSMLLSSLLNLDDSRLLKKEMKLRMVSNQLADYQLDGGLGLERNKEWMGENRQRLVGKTGFTGTLIVWDPQTTQGLVMLANATYPNRPEDRSKLMMVRQQLCDTVFAIS